jgi:hypothetical protein
MKFCRWLFSMMTVLLMTATGPVAGEFTFAADTGQAATVVQDSTKAGVADDRSFSVYGNWRGTGFPPTDLYPRYIADPLEPSLSMQYLFVSDSDIPDTGDSRFLFNLGGRFGLIRFYPGEQADTGFQIDVQAAFIGMFDNDNSQDNIGWDGIYGVLLTWADGRGTAAKFGLRHDSSHRGDEYIERTGLTRINYTREEILLGFSRNLFSDWRIYGEGGYGIDLRNDDFQEPWRLQGGLEYEDNDRLWGGRMGWYAAADLTSYEENDWDLNVSVQAGLVAPIRNQTGRFRFGGAYYNGRSILGEFSQFDEEYFSVGIWVDL